VTANFSLDFKQGPDGQSRDVRSLGKVNFMSLNDVLSVELRYKSWEEVLGTTFHYRESTAVDRSVGSQQLARGFLAALDASGLMGHFTPDWLAYSANVTYPDVLFANPWEELTDLSGFEVGSVALPDACILLLNLQGTDINQEPVDSVLQISGVPQVQTDRTAILDSYRDTFTTAVIDNLLVVTGDESGEWTLCVPTRPNAPGDRTIVPVDVDGVQIDPFMGNRYDRKQNTPNTGRKEPVSPAMRQLKASERQAKRDAAAEAKAARKARGDAALERKRLRDEAAGRIPQN